MSERRGPTLADQFIMASHKRVLVDLKHHDQLKARLRANARRFVFDDLASARFGAVIRDVPDLLVREQQFARAPYDVTWIELDMVAVRNVVNPDREPPTDIKIGFLIDHGTVYTIALGSRGHCDLLPFSYDLHTEWSVEDQLKFAEIVGVSRAQLDASFWGSSFNKLTGDDKRVLRARHAMRVLPLVPNLARRLKDKDHILGPLYLQTIGDLRNVVTALLLLNRPSLTTYKQEVPHQRVLVGGKLRTYLSHTVIAIPLDPVPTLQLVGTPGGEGVPRRRHEVRGHYCHDERARGRGCVHEWVVDPKPDDDPLDPDHWRCQRCEGKRWWRRDHARGSANLGFNLHTYQVT